MKRSLTPDSQFKIGLFKKLSAAGDNNYNVKYAWYQTVWFKHAAGFALVVLVVGSLGTGAYAYSSPVVTEGSILYPIKEKLEKIEEIAQITPEAKAKFYLKKIERREVERKILKENEGNFLQEATSTVQKNEKAEKPEIKVKKKILYRY